MIEGWILGLPEVEASLLQAALAANPGNPSKTERDTRGRRPEVDTPRLALLRNLDGTYDVGIPADGWSMAAVLARGTYTVAARRDHPQIDWGARAAERGDA